MRTVLALLLSIGLASAGHANPFAAYYDAPPPQEDGGWTRTVAAPCSLAWDGVSFEGALEFRFRADTLRVNGVVVDIDRSPAWLEVAPNSPLQLHMYALSLAESFEDWVAIYRASRLVRRLRVKDRAIEVLWADPPGGGWEYVTYPQGARAALYRKTWNFVDRVVRELEKGMNVIVIKGVAAISMRPASGGPEKTSTGGR